MMGSEVTPLEVRPRFSNTREENVRLVRATLVDAGKRAEAEEFVHLVELLETHVSDGQLDGHPVSIAAEKVGAAVHWVP